MGIDQRKNQRYLCVDGGVLRLSIRPEFRGRRAILSDLSTGGIGFVLEGALDVGSVLVFELKGADGSASNRLARVRHCRPHPAPKDAPWLPQMPALSKMFRALFRGKPKIVEEQAWLVGCAFDQPLTDDELQQLLKSFERTEDAQE
jgi:hypothetical protein